MVLRRSRSALLACTAFLTLVMGTASLAQTVKQDVSTGAAAQNGDTPTVLKPIVVKGSRAASKDVLADTPLASETTAQTIDDKQINSFDDLGRSTEVGVSTSRINSSVNIRGLDDDRVLTTIDGIRIPFLLDGARDADGGTTSFDFNTLSTIDIVRGADSSRGGSGMLGGAVVLRTLEPGDLIKPGATWGGVFKLDYDGDDNSIGGSAAIAKQVENTAVLFQGGYRKGHETENNGDIGGYSTTRTETNPVDYDQKNMLFKIRQYTDTGSTFGLTAEHFDKDQDIDLMTLQIPNDNFRPGNYDGSNDVKRDRVSLDYKFEATDDDALFDSANATLFWQKLVRENGVSGYRYTSVIGDYSRNNSIEDNGFGFAGNAEKAFDTGNFHHNITTGLDISFDKTSQYSAGIDNCGPGPYRPFATCNFLHTNQSDMPDIDGKRVGAFVDDKISLGSSPFSLTPGVRFDWYDYSPQNTEAYSRSANYSGMPAGQSDSRFSPKLRAAFQPQDDVEIYAQYAMAFRAPNVTELYENYGVPGGYVSYGNPNLKPETSNGIELGTNLGDKDFGGHIGVFYNKYKNFIDSVNFPDPTGIYPLGITEYFNRASVRSYGLEANIHKTFDNGIHINGAFAYSNGKDSETGVYISSDVPAKAALGIGYATETWGSDVTFVTATSQPKRDNDKFVTPGYGVLDLTAWAAPEQVKGLTLRAGVYNIFDKTYYNPANTNGTLTQPLAYYSEPGRVFKVSLTQTF
jgi:hemoglobin/transferrin/lactoferrin receptor protein